VMTVEKGPPTDLAQNASTWGGIPDHLGCSYKWYDSYASINIADTTRTEVIWGDTCSTSDNEGGTISGMAIAFIEEGHYVTAFIVGATSSTALSSDTTLSGILSGISFVTTKPADANTGGGGSDGGSGGAFDKDSLNTGGQPTLGSYTFSTGSEYKSACLSSLGARYVIKFIDANTLEFSTFSNCTSNTDGTVTYVFGYDFEVGESLTNTAYDMTTTPASVAGEKAGFHATTTSKYMTSTETGSTSSGDDSNNYTAFYPESNDSFWFQSFYDTKGKVTEATSVVIKLEL